ncbi:MMPL family transporter [Curtobacterium sp. Leaf261]|uniref:MMPL family transporter n=1 Tax=Curtobacterium sp. Leaf261 TaxID=1736311 RepID=UPI0006F3B051|nr:MMPL family transporter [Curtobacterium sp. Leaf261]KQO61360.1 RND transporter [Curtobacterium sp. Leaf261]
MAGLLYRLGRFAARRHWYVIVAWVLLLALGGVGYSLFAGTTSSNITIPGTATAKVQDELADKFPKASGGSGTIVFATKDDSAFTDAQKADIKSFLGDIDDVTAVKSTVNPFTTESDLEAQRQKITDGRSQIADGKQQIADAQTQLDAGKQQLEAAQQQLDTQKAQAEAAGQLPAVQAQLDAGQAQLDAQQQQITSGQATIDANTTKLQQQATELEQGADLLDLSKNVRFVSKDDSAAVATVQFSKSTYDVPQASKTKIGAMADDARIAGVDVQVSNDIAQGVPSVLGPGEIIGVVIAAIVLVIMLGTIIGAALPLVSAILGVGVASLAALSFSSLVEFTSVTPVLGVMLGLAVGIDYSLFILNRHRAQLKQGMGVHESIGLANGTSGNAVVFAGATVVVALLALNITGVPFLGLMGTVGAVAVAVAILVATTFTPAVMSLLGMRLLRKKERAAIGTTGATRVPNAPMNTVRAIVTLVLGIAVLGTIALPAMQMRLGLPDGSSEAVGSSQYNAFKTVEDKFGAGQNGPLVAVATLPSRISDADVTATEVTIGKAIAKSDDVSAVAPIGASSDNSVIAFQVIPKGGPSSVSTENLVKDLRDLSVQVDGGTTTLGVAGNASANIDVSEKLANVLPLYLVVVVGLSLIILIIVFRSILVPITATVGFILSLLASFGGLTAIYQFGWLSAVFGTHDPGPILSFLPIIEIGILFGLAMDYQLFLVSGMRESFAHGAPAKIAVQRGVHAGRAVVTAAAIIMMSVFAGFIFSDSSTIKPIGFGLAFGVMVDAFVVRMLLIPAAMHLLGTSAWWFPKWLDRIVPDVDVEGAKLERSHPGTERGPGPGTGHGTERGTARDGVEPEHHGSHAAPTAVDAPAHATEHTSHGSHAAPIAEDASAHHTGHGPAHRA